MRNYTISLPHGSKLIVTDNLSVIETASHSAAENNCNFQMIDFISKDNGIYYNPFKHIRNWRDISIISGEMLAKPNQENHIETNCSRAERQFLSALIAYMHDVYELKDQKFKTLSELVSRDDLDDLFSNFEKTHSDHIAVEKYKEFKDNEFIDDKRLPGFIISMSIVIAGYLHPAIDQALAQDNLDFDEFSRQKTILLIKLDPNNTFFDCFAHMLSRQLMNYYHITKVCIKD